jgi:hypothetical protein
MSVMCEDADDMPNGEGEYGEAAARRSSILGFRIKMWDLADFCLWHEPDLSV